MGSPPRISAQKESTVVTANATAKTAARRQFRASGYVAQSGTTTSAASFVHAPSAAKVPRPTADDAAQNPQIRKAGMIASFVFELSTYCVNGFATHAKASRAASRVRPKRKPTATKPSTASRSKRRLVKWTG